MITWKLGVNTRPHVFSFTLEDVYESLAAAELEHSTQPQSALVPTTVEIDIECTLSLIARPVPPPTVKRDAIEAPLPLDTTFGLFKRNEM